MKKICAWCKVHLEGDKNDTEITHGICKECYDKEIDRYGKYLMQAVKTQCNGFKNEK